VYEFSPVIPGQQLVTFTSGSKSGSITINVAEDDGSVNMLSSATKYHISTLGYSIISVTLTNDSVWATEVDTAEWDPTIIFPNYLTHLQSDGFIQENGEPARYVATYLYQPIVVGSQTIAFTHDNEGTVLSTEVIIETTDSGPTAGGSGDPYFTPFF
jgi:hypothetical protein